MILITFPHPIFDGWKGHSGRIDLKSVNLNPLHKINGAVLAIFCIWWISKYICSKSINFWLRCSYWVKFNITMNFCYAFLLLFSVMRTTSLQISAMRWCCFMLWEQQRNNNAMLFSNENVVLKILIQNNASRNLEPLYQRYITLKAEYILSAPHCRFNVIIT